MDFSESTGGLSKSRSRLSGSNIPGTAAGKGIGSFSKMPDMSTNIVDGFTSLECANNDVALPFTIVLFHPRTSVILISNFLN